ncbi:triose-phosphate transporter family-domain-containing protein [Cantharellus anzutake]|uniref:triose-phosphate transporter family-domain-containing protein n=1 Tax=Cantharellus anzutake TaxID=1750568 RepID=UPI0019084E4D|nr:triose-phosphate transporter family-domain-containing protein [Cantharellus anzutake]KAF8336583.1 triose-phosphate transporter family-domain-containing protein [Cantharellus anzutake]
MDSITRFTRFNPESLSPPIATIPGPSRHRTPLRTRSPRIFVPREVQASLLSSIPTSQVWHGPAKTAGPGRQHRVAFAPAKDSSFYWLSLFFFFNLALTLYNKGLLVNFPFPYTLTAIHALFSFIGCTILHKKHVFHVAQLDVSQHLILAAFSFLYTINVALSNISLKLVTVPFHQVVRGLSPLFTLILSYFMFNTTVSRNQVFALAPVIIGVGLATYGDYYFTPWGLFLTLLGTFLASLKGIVSHALQTRPLASIAYFWPSSAHASVSLKSPIKLHPLDLLYRMSLLAFSQCVVYIYLSGEFERLWEFAARGGPGGSKGISPAGYASLVLNGLLAFGLNYASFTASGKVGALAMSVAANIKQVLTVALAILIFNLRITPMNTVGFVCTLAGGAWFGAKHRENNTKQQLQHRSQDSRDMDRDIAFKMGSELSRK